MRVFLFGLVGIFILTACGSQTPALNHQTPGPADEVSTIEAVALASPVVFDPPPSLSSGTFSALMTTSINEAIFEGKDINDFSVVGVIEAEGLLYVYFHNGGAIFYAVSSDGVDWALSPEPIFFGLINDDFEFFPSSVNTLHDGFAIYLGSSTINYAEYDYLYSFWALTAPQPTGPWTLGELPILFGYAGEEGIAFYIAHPLIRPYLNGFRMLYGFSFTLDGIGDPEYGIAHSRDGIFWRYTADLPTPEMEDEIIGLGLAPEYEWEGLQVLDFWQTETGWQMLYLLDEDENQTDQINVAESEDGLLWTPTDLEIQLPIVFPTDNLISATALYFQDRYVLIYCGMPQFHAFQCYSAALES